MSAVGVIARADQGGLASLCYEVVRHLHPERVLIVDLGRNARGGESATDLSWYDGLADEIVVTAHRNMRFEVDRFFQKLDVVYTAETVYDDRIFQIARNSGTKIILHAMPELFWGGAQLADVLWNPTHWRQEHLPARCELVPVPVALDRLPYRRRLHAETFFATSGEAMLDRNGSKIVAEALGHLRHPCQLLYRGGPPPQQKSYTVGTVDVHWLPPVDRYVDVIPEETDVMLMPRRYGGLALPVQEAAARGIPTVMTLLNPQSQWIARDLLIPATVLEDGAEMKGGKIPVYTADPRALAATMDRLITNPQRVADASDAAYQWARARSWDQLLPEWQARIDKAATLTRA